MLVARRNYSDAQRRHSYSPPPSAKHPIGYYPLSETCRRRPQWDSDDDSDDDGSTDQSYTPTPEPCLRLNINPAPVYDKLAYIYRASIKCLVRVHMRCAYPIRYVKRRVIDGRPPLIAVRYGPNSAKRRIVEIEPEEDDRMGNPRRRLERISPVAAKLIKERRARALALGAAATAQSQVAPETTPEPHSRPGASPEPRRRVVKASAGSTVGRQVPKKRSPGGAVCATSKPTGVAKRPKISKTAAIGGSLASKVAALPARACKAILSWLTPTVNEELQPEQTPAPPTIGSRTQIRQSTPDRIAGTLPGAYPFSPSDSRRVVLCARAGDGWRTPGYASDSEEELLGSPSPRERHLIMKATYARAHPDPLSVGAVAKAVRPRRRRVDRPTQTGAFQVEQPVNEELSFLEDAPASTPESVTFEETGLSSHLPQPPAGQTFFPEGEPVGFNAGWRLRSPFRDARTPPPPAGDVDIDDSLAETPERFPNAPNNSPAHQSSAHDVESVAELGEALERAFTGGARAEREESPLEMPREVAEHAPQPAIGQGQRGPSPPLREVLRPTPLSPIVEEDEEPATQGDDQVSLSDYESDGDEQQAGALAPALAAPEVRLVKPLPVAWASQVDQALRTRPSSASVATVRGVPLTRHDLGTLLPETPSEGPGWLNDEIVNAYLGSLVDRTLQSRGYDRAGGMPPPVAAFNSAWYGVVSSKGPAAVARWSRRAGLDGSNLLAAETILIPVNDAYHWTLLVISGTRRSIWYLDSLGGTGGKYIAAAKAWLKNELGGDWHEEDWRVLATSSGLQQNAIDCGVFTCLNGVAVVRGLNPQTVIGHADIVAGRRQIAATLLNGGFGGAFDWVLGIAGMEN